MSFSLFYLRRNEHVFLKRFTSGTDVFESKCHQYITGTAGLTASSDKVLNCWQLNSKLNPRIGYMFFQMQSWTCPFSKFSMIKYEHD